MTPTRRDTNTTKAFRTSFQDAIRACPLPEKGVDDYRLSSTERLVAFVMSTYGDSDGRNVYPSAGAIARGGALTRRAVIQCRLRLCDAGWLELVRQGGSDLDGKRTTSLYRLVIPSLTGESGLPVNEGDRCTSRHRLVNVVPTTGERGAPNKENPYKETDKGSAADPSCDECKGKGFTLPLTSDTVVACSCRRPTLRAVQ